MHSILCSRSLSSALFAEILRTMLVMRSSLIIEKGTSSSNEKTSGDIDIDLYTHEYLLAEFERRHHRLQWFHDHTEHMVTLRDALSTFIQEWEGPMQDLSPVLEAIVHNDLDAVPAFIKKHTKQRTLQLLTSPLVRAGWAQ